MGFSKERIRQIEEKAVRKLRYSLEAKHLKDYLDQNDEFQKQIQETQEELSKTLGKSRSAIANTERILNFSFSSFMSFP